jgi:hypothetical protein
MFSRLLSACARARAAPAVRTWARSSSLVARRAPSLAAMHSGSSASISYNTVMVSSRIAVHNAVSRNFSSAVGGGYMQTGHVCYYFLSE